MKKFFKPFSISLIAAAISLPVLAQDVTLKFQSSDQAGNQNFELQSEWATTVNTMSGGRIAIELLPAGAVVAYKETLDAVSAGILDGHITDTSYFAGKDPAFGLIANPVGAWSDPSQMIRFMEYGGGNELMRDIYNDYGVHFIGATTPGLEAFVSKVPLEGVDDLKGLKLRAPEGLVQKVFAAAGAAPVNLPGSEVFTSLDKGVIDAADFTVYSTNQAQGLNDIAKHPVYPGFHSMPLVEISMNKAKWDAMPEDLQAIMTVSVRDYARDLASRIAIADMKAVATDKANPEITVHDWSADERAKFRGIAVGQWAEVAKDSANAQKVFDTLTTYLQDQGLISADALK